MKSIDDLLQKALGRPEMYKAVQALHLARNWPEVVGEKLASRTKVSDFKEGVLWISCASSSCATELRMHREMLLAKLNQGLREPLIQELKFTVKPPRLPL